MVLSYTRAEFMLGFSKHFKCQQSLGTYIFPPNPLIGADGIEQRVPTDTGTCSPAYERGRHGGRAGEEKGIHTRHVPVLVLF